MFLKIHMIGRTTIIKLCILSVFNLSICFTWFLLWYLFIFYNMFIFFFCFLSIYAQRSIGKGKTPKAILMFDNGSERWLVYVKVLCLHIFYNLLSSHIRSETEGLSLSIYGFAYAIHICTYTYIPELWGTSHSRIKCI